MSGKKVTLSNSFHGTKITVLQSSADALDLYRGQGTPAQKQAVRRIRAKLCGSNECTCGVVR